MSKEKLYQAPVYVKKSAIHGYGVFAAKNFVQGEVIEECHTLLTSSADPEFRNYYFNAKGKSAIPLGYGCIYNHSDQPNINFSYDPQSGLIIFTALKAIQAGEELCSSYGKHWFSSRSLKVRTASLQRRIFRFLRLPLRFILIYLGLLAFIHGLPYLSS